MTELAGIQTPEPTSGEAERVSEVRVARWDALRPSRGDWPNLVGSSDARDEVIRDLRELADFLETRPEIPVPPRHHRIPYTVFAAGTDAEKLAQVDYMSTLLGAKVKDETPDGGHCLTGASFGSIEYQFVAIPKKPLESLPAVFGVGREVRLVPEVARSYRLKDIPQAGVSVSRDSRGHGESVYLVQVPGRLSLSFAGSMLEPACFGPFATSRGVIRSLADAEAALTVALARSRFNQSRGKPADPGDTQDAEKLGPELARACGVAPKVLIGHLEGAIDAEIGKLQAAQRAALRDAAAQPVLTGGSDSAQAVQGRRDPAAVSQPTPRQRR